MQADPGVVSRTDTSGMYFMVPQGDGPVAVKPPRG